MSSIENIATEELLNNKETSINTIFQDEVIHCLDVLLEKNVINYKEYQEKNSKYYYSNQIKEIVNKEVKEHLHHKEEEEIDTKPIWVEVINFTKQYSKKSKPIVNNISFNIRKGEFHAFIGANGAGKTTTMKALVGAYAKWDGKILINGISNQKADAKKIIGYVPEKAVFPKSFTSLQYLVSMAKMSGLSSKDAEKFANEKLIEIGMKQLANKKPYNFSSGQKKKILLAQALCTNPDILILDEPAANLDPTSRIELFELLKKLQNQGKSIFISSHILSELGKYANVATILDGGKIVYHGVIDKNQDLEKMYSKYVKIGSIHTEVEKN